MDIQCLPSSSPSSSFNPKTAAKTCPIWSSTHSDQNTTTICFFKPRMLISRSYYGCGCGRLQWKKRSWAVGKVYVTKAKKSFSELEEKPVEVPEKKGTIAGAVALIIGTSIGSGILALPKKAAPAGFIPSSVTMIICWAFLLIEALLLVEINVGLLRKKKKKLKGNDLEVISIRTMAQETLGEWGGNLATITFIFLGYTSMVAYSSKSGEILYHFINIPESYCGFFFTVIFAILISVGGTRATDQVNQWLTASMIGLLVAIEVLAVVFGGWSGEEGSRDWGKVPATIPVIIFSLVYHDLAPVLCAYLGGDLTRIRTSVLLGSLVPLLALLMWDAIALGLSAQAEQLSDPVELLMSFKWSGISIMVEAFSLLAIGTSLIGTLLSFSQFFKEQLNELSWNSTPRQALPKQYKLFGLGNWWKTNKISFTATAMVIAPTLVVSTTVPDAFSAATDIAGGYCMTLLYGVLPPAMAWAMHNREAEDTDQKALARARPALVGVGLFACGVVMEQLFQDTISVLHP